MRKIYLPLLLLLLLSNANVFGQPGCASVTITTNGGNDFALPCASPCTTLSATAVQTSGETSTYSVSSIPYAPPYAFNTGTPILVGQDDIWSDVISLPFTFCFYGTSYTQILAGANGDISFAVGDANSTCEWEFSSTCPSADLIPAGNIFGPYHDIDPSVGGAMYYAILGSYPCRTFVVNWYQIPMFDCNELITTHQTVLYETSNIIEVYMQSIPLCSSWNDGNAVVGIQNPAGSVGLAAPGRNTSAWSTSNEAWRFTPTGSTTVGITWFQGATQIGTGNSINVCPAGPTTYTAQATYSTCFGVPVTVDDDITLSLTGGSVVLTPTNPTICSGGSVTLNASGSNTYTWSPGTGLNQTTGSSVIASPTVTTTYTVTGVVPGCTTTNTITVNVGTTTLPAFTQLGPYCVGAAPGTLPTTSTNGITGTWNAAISTASAGTTVYTFTPTAGQCASNATMSVVVNANITPTFTQLGPYCVGALPGTLPTTSNNGITGTWNAAISTATAGTTVYTFTPTAGQCASTVTMSVVVTTNITPTFTQLGPYCAGAAPGTLPTTSTNGITGTWSPATVSTSTSGNTTYTFTPTAGQCASTTTMTVTVNAVDNPAFNYTPNAFCQTGTDPSANITGGASGTFTSSPAGLVFLNSSTGQIDVSASAINTYTVTFTTNGLCPSSSNVSVSITLPPAATFNYAGPYCQNAANPMPTFGSGASAGTFSATPAGLVFVSTSTGQVNLASSTPGTYTVTNTIAASGGCAAASATATITINANPTVTVPANIVVCNTGNVSATNFVSNPAGASFAWTNSNPAIGIGGNGSGNIPSFTATNSGNSPITATISVTPTLNSCVGSPSTYTITVNPTPTVMVPANSTVCNGAQIATANFTSPVSGATFTWTNSNTAIGLNANGTGNIPAFNATNTGTAPITATITVTPSANNCTGTSSSYTITVNPTPTVNVPANIVVCSGAVVSGSAFTSPTTGTTYAWTNSNTAIGLPGSGVGDVPTFSATNTSTGAIVATIAVTPTANTCPGTPSSYTITVNPLPVITFSAMPQLCITSPEFVLTQASPSGGTYSGTGVTGTSFSPAAAGIGTHTITYNYTDPVTGCSNTATTQIVITTGLTITVSPNNPFFCAGGSVLLTAVGATDFSWQPNIGLSATTGGNVIASPNSSTIYTVLGSNPDGCSGSTTVAVGVYTVPAFSIIAFPNEGCSPLDVTFSYAPAGPIDTNSLQWNFGDLASIDNTSDLINPEHVFNYEGSYTVYLGAETNDGCPVSATDTVRAYRKPIADFYFNPEVGYMDDPEIGFVDISVGANAWSWDFGNPSSYNLNYSVLQNPFHTYTDTGTYIVELIVSSSHNCSDTIEKPVTIYPSVVIYIPNAFTPNGDLLNDTWKPSISGIDKDNYHLNIYDRWGKVMFTTNDINEGWNGKYNEKPCPEAVYVYMIDYNTKPTNEHKVIRGAVTLVK